jgi:hypothetical protein
MSTVMPVYEQMSPIHDSYMSKFGLVRFSFFLAIFKQRQIALFA